MNIKKYTLKTMCATLACSTLLSGLLVANATAIISESPMEESGDGGSEWTADERSFEEIEVTYRQVSSYNVIIPKTITLDKSKQAAYSVKVTGDIDSNERVHVVPVDGISSSEGIDFYMKDQTPDSKKDDVVATVTQSKFYWSSEDVANGYEETNNSVSAQGLTAGTWKGTFQVAINLETEKEHEHNYKDGKCDCGAIDPDHTHDYEDGACTICGKEADPCEVAPANEYSEWDYTLDNENNIITLNYYKGSRTDVIVYANYEIGGKTYKTKISNGTSGYVSQYMFANKPTIKTIKFSKDIDTSNVTDMSYMFGGCEGLTSLDISNFNTSNVKYMDFMFYNCRNLTELDLSSFDTSNVTNMYRMFNNDQALTSLDLHNFDTSKVTNMQSMFNECRGLTSLDLSNFDTGKVTDMQQMFSYCMSLESLDLSNFDTSNVTNMMQMFYASSSLTSLDLSGFNTANVTKMGYMFGSCNSLKTIYVTSGKWSTSKANTANMFNSCGTSSVTYK